MRFESVSPSARNVIDFLLTVFLLWGKLPQTFTCEKDTDLSIRRKRKCKTAVLHRRKTVRQLSCTCLTRKSLYLSVNCRLGNSSHTDFVLQNPLSCFHPGRAIFDEFLSSPDWFIERKHSKSRKDKISHGPYIPFKVAP